MQNTIILKSLDSLKQRLSKANNKLNLQNEQGNTSTVTCSFNSPVEQREIKSFENNTEWTLPIDYKIFYNNTMELASLKCYWKGI